MTIENNPIIRREVVKPDISDRVPLWGVTGWPPQITSRPTYLSR